MRVGDVAQVVGTVRETQHLQGEQYNVRLETADGETLWIQSHLLQVLVPAPTAEDGPPVLEPVEATPQSESSDRNGWRHENAAWVRPNLEVTGQAEETPSEQTEAEAPSEQTEAETEAEAPPEAETPAKV